MVKFYMLMGLPGTGKTTVGRRLERDCPALLLCPDVWMARLVSDGYGAKRREAVKQLQLELADQVLRLGRDVVLEFGFFRRQERDEARALASKAGAKAELILLDPPFEELVRRVEARNRDLPPDTFPVTREHLELCVTWLKGRGRTRRFPYMASAPAQSDATGRRPASDWISRCTNKEI